MSLCLIDSETNVTDPTILIVLLNETINNDNYYSLFSSHFLLSNTNKYSPFTFVIDTVVPNCGMAAMYHSCNRICIHGSCCETLHYLRHCGPQTRC